MSIGKRNSTESTEASVGSLQRGHMSCSKPSAPYMKCNGEFWGLLLMKYLYVGQSILLGKKTSMGNCGLGVLRMSSRYVTLW